MADAPDIMTVNKATSRARRSQRTLRAGPSQELQRESHEFRSDLSQDFRLEISRTLLRTTGQGADLQRFRPTKARRANHGFLTQPIARQALLVVAPEYNRFAPVLAKPVRQGLDALARGTLLQTYALAVAVARLTEHPVEHAAATLAAADAGGK